MTDDAVGTLGLICILLGSVSIGAALPHTVGLVLLVFGGVLWIAGNR